MTDQEISDACVAIDVGWDFHNGGTILNPPTDYCNRYHCIGIARMATDAGVTAEEAAAAVKAEIEGDRQPLLDIAELAAIERAP